MSLYAWLMLLSFAGPFALSFDKKVAFYKYWPGLFIGIFINAMLFIIWDGWFVEKGIWGFNPDYVLPFRVFNLPLEEWSFFVVIPYASIFIYACLKVYLKKAPFANGRWYITILAFVFVLVTMITNLNHTYTLVNCAIAAILLLVNIVFIRAKYMGYFWLAYLIHLIPFFIVNGILTGAATAEPIVWYNNNEIIGLRLYTIPFEDTIYAFICMLLPINIMEYVNAKWFKK